MKPTPRLRSGLLGLALLAAPPAMADEAVPLSEGWRFVKEDVRGGERPGLDDARWARVAVPHTYNAEDSGIGGAKARGEPEGERG